MSSANRKNTSYHLNNENSNNNTLIGDVAKLQQDIAIVSNKIAELNGDQTTSIPTSGNQNINMNNNKVSPFVVGLRGQTENHRQNNTNDKIILLETLLEKVCEYDRAILRKTAPVDLNGNLPPPRRKSLGIDLLTLPSHFHLIDRLLDLFTQSKRVTVINNSSKQNNNIDDNHTTNIDSNNNNNNLKVNLVIKGDSLLSPRGNNNNNENNNMNLINNNKIIEELQETIETLKIKLNESEMKQKVVIDDYTNIKSEINILKENLQNNSHMKLLKNEINDMKSQLLEKDQIIENLYHRIEDETSRYHDILNIILGKASRINNNQDLKNSIDDCQSM
eukprot:gene14599-19606_t